MTPASSFQCEVEESGADSQGNKLTMVKCYGRLMSETAADLKGAVKPLLEEGGRIVIDLGDVNYLDSSGLGALVGLKVSAIRQGLCILEFVNMTPRVLELMRISNLVQMLSA
jgi:anti-sigma B factor antagonist